MRQLHDEGAQIRPRIVREDLSDRLGRLRAQSQNPVGELVGLAPHLMAAYDAAGGAAKILDEDDAQRDRHRPQFADRQRLHRLIGIDEFAEEIAIEATVGVGDIGPGHTEHPRQPGERTGGQLGKLAVVARRQIAAHFEYLLLDNVIIVENPLGGRRYRLAVLHGGGDVAVGGEQHPLVVAQPVGQRAAALLA